MIGPTSLKRRYCSRFSRSASDSPLRCSNTRRCAPSSVAPTSRSWQTYGLWMAEAIVASRWKRRTEIGLHRRAGEQDLDGDLEARPRP